jgi:carbonic anhydrase
MRTLKRLFENNRKWAADITAKDPSYFTDLWDGQQPEYLWIGCSDSRIIANQTLGLPLGSVFVHRNVANLVPHTDFNVLSVIQYAVEVLEVRHVIVCGHYGCGGVKAALEGKQHGLIDNWLRHIKDVYYQHRSEIEALPTDRARFDRMCELNVMAQVGNVAYTTIVQNAWKRGKELSVHGWIFDLRDGLLKDLDLCISDTEQVARVFRMD